MEKVLITCPFTGLEFEALKYADGHIIAHHAITGEEIKINYNSSCNRYMIHPRYFKHVPMLSMDEAADELLISKPRISALVKKGRLQTVRPDNQLYITKDSVLQYQQHQRKLAAEKSGNGTRDN